MPWLIFAVLMYTEEEINDLETVVSMLFCGALERSNNLYIESIVEPFLRIKKRSSLCGFDWEENPEKGLRQWKRVPMSWKRNLCIWYCEREKLAALKLL